MNDHSGTRVVSSLVPCAIKAKCRVDIERTRKSSAEGLSIISGLWLEKWTPNGKVWDSCGGDSPTHCKPENPLFSRGQGWERYRAGRNRAGMPPRHQLPASHHWLLYVLFGKNANLYNHTLCHVSLNTGNQWASKRFTCKYQTSIYRNDAFIFWRKYTWKKMETNNIRHLFLPCNYSGTLNLLIF